MEFMVQLYSKVRSEEVAPEMCAVLYRASARVDPKGFLMDLDVVFFDLTPVDEGELGLTRTTFTRRLFQRSSVVTDMLTT